MFLKIRKIHKKHLHQSLFLIKLKKENSLLIIKKEISAQVFSCEFCEVFKNTFFIEHLRAIASGLNALAKMWNQG